MLSLNHRSRGSDKSRRPLKAFQLPTSTSASSISAANKGKPRKGPKTYWTDSEDNCSLLSSAECSSPGSNEGESLPKSSPPLVEKSGLRRHYQTIVGVKRSSSRLVEGKGSINNCPFHCACCCSPLLPLKRPHVVMGAEGLRRLRQIPTPLKSTLPISPPPKTPNLAPICPVPMLPSYLTPQCQPDPAIPSRRSIASQTSPSGEERKPKRKPSKRNSGALLSSIKKTISSLRRPMSTEKFPSRALFHDTPSTVKLSRETSDSNKVTICTLLQRFPDGSRTIKLTRPSPSAQFGLYVRDDEKGMIVTRLGSLKFLEKNNFLHRGDHILEVQHISSQQLNCDQMRKLLSGSLTATIKVASVPT